MPEKCQRKNKLMLRTDSLLRLILRGDKRALTGTAPTTAAAKPTTPKPTTPKLKVMKPKQRVTPVPSTGPASSSSASAIATPITDALPKSPPRRPNVHKERVQGTAATGGKQNAKASSSQSAAKPLAKTTQRTLNAYLTRSPPVGAPSASLARNTLSEQLLSKVNAHDVLTCRLVERVASTHTDLSFTDVVQVLRRVKHEGSDHEGILQLQAVAKQELIPSEEAMSSQSSSQSSSQESVNKPSGHQDNEKVKAKELNGAKRDKEEGLKRRHEVQQNNDTKAAKKFKRYTVPEKPVEHMPNSPELRNQIRSVLGHAC